MHPEFELQTAGRVTSPGVYRGAEEVRRFFEDLLEPFEEVTVEPLEFFEREDRIAVFVLVRSRPTGSTATVENRVGHVWTVRQGRLARLEMYPRREDAIEAAGLRA